MKSKQYILCGGNAMNGIAQLPLLVYKYAGEGTKLIFLSSLSALR